jgi:uncharacterized protein DUF4337
VRAVFLDDKKLLSRSSEMHFEFNHKNHGDGGEDDPSENAGGISSHNSTSSHNPRFFLILSIFIGAISVLAAYSSITASQLNVTATHSMSEATSHLVNASDWWNDYQAHKLREKVWETQIDNLNVNLASASLSDAQTENVTGLTSKYNAYLDKLYADNSTENSLANLSDKAKAEEEGYRNSVDRAEEKTSFTEGYEAATTFLVISSGLGGVSNITKRKLLGYPSFGIGAVGIVVFLFVLFGYIAAISL